MESAKTLPEFYDAKLKEIVEADSEKVFLHDASTERKLYYKDMLPLSNKIASALSKYGVKKGSVVMHMTDHHIQHLPLALGVWKANAVLRCLYSGEDHDTILEKLQETKCRVFFCDEGVLHRVEQAIKNYLHGFPVKIIVCGYTDGRDIVDSHDQTTFEQFVNQGSEDDCPNLELDENETAIIFPTSGTSGPCKGAMYTHKVFLELLKKEFSVLVKDKPSFVITKASHLGGTFFPLGILTSGAEGVVVSSFDQEGIFEAVDKYKPGLVFCFVHHALALANEEVMMKYDTSSVELVILSGCGVGSSRRKDIFKLPSVKRIIVGYGMTECTRISVDMYDRDNSDQSTSYILCQVKIHSLETFEPLEVGERGEIWAKGLMFSGYYKDGKATRAALENGFVRTGDVGFIDEKGVLHVVDRAKDIFKYWNHHICPSEIEDIVRMHACVKDALVVPMEFEGGHVPKVLVILKDPGDVELDVKEPSQLPTAITEYSDRLLSDHKKLRGGVHVVKEFPTGLSGKTYRPVIHPPSRGGSTSEQGTS